MEIKKLKSNRTLSALKKIFHFLILLLFTVSTILLSESVYSENLTNSTIKKSDNQRCLPSQAKKNVVFLKTHKCASSAVQNIFLRYGFTHNLKFVLPTKGNYLGHPALFSHKFVPDGKYNLIAHHTRLNYPEMSLIMEPGTIYVTVLRNPVTMFESMYNYYDLEKFYKFKFKMFDAQNVSMPDMSRRFASRIGLNQMFFDLGFDLSKSKANFEPYIKYLDSIFDLVMIEEYMDESLVMLKNLLCWSSDDVVTFKLNARIEKQEIGELSIGRIKRLNRADVELYDYFSKKFEKKLADQADRLESEVQELINRRKYWYDECVDAKKMNEQILKTSNNSRLNIVQFSSKKDDDSTCKFLTSKELELTKLVLNHQLKLYPESVFKSTFKKSMIMRHRPVLPKNLP